MRLIIAIELLVGCLLTDRDLPPTVVDTASVSECLSLGVPSVSCDLLLHFAVAVALSLGACLQHRLL